MYSLPGVVGEMVAYIVPAYLLAGIHYPDNDHLSTFYTYIGNTVLTIIFIIPLITGYMLLYLLCVCMLFTSMAYTLSSRHLTVGILGLWWPARHWCQDTSYMQMMSLCGCPG